MTRVVSSFRDAAGQVYDGGEAGITRTIMPAFAEHWQYGIDSGFLASAVASNALVAFRESRPRQRSWKTLEVDRIPFISYPYEWCFSQLRDAAILTLDLHMHAVRHGMILKDANAYNVQFSGARPVFIDLLSFEKWVPGTPWSAYRMFCMHFLAPLALTAYVDYRLNLLSKLWVDGTPLDLAATLLPARTWLRFGLASHIHLHAKFEKKYGDARQARGRMEKVRVKKAALINLADNLASTVRGLKPGFGRTEWGDYYNDTNYIPEAADAKLRLVEGMAATYGNAALAVDLGANTGRYSAALAPYFKTVVAADIDPLAVEKHYRTLRSHGPRNVLPLVIDLANPSPSLGWAHRERDSFATRCDADFITALALVHHLVIGSGIPLDMVAEYFAELLVPNGVLVVEFVPKEDSQVQRLLAAREDIFPSYHLAGLREAFRSRFLELEEHPIPGSLRTLLVFRKKS